MTSASLGKTQLFDGDTGQDSVVFDKTEAAGIARFVKWETISLINESQVTSMAISSWAMPEQGPAP